MKKLFMILIMVIMSFSIFAEISKFTMDGNIDIIYDYDKSYNISAITVFFDGGTLNYKPDNAGIETFLLQSVQKGSEKYPLETYDMLIDRYGIHADFAADYDYSYIGFSSINKYFPQTVDILIQSLKTPLFDEKQVENVKQKIIADLNQEADVPDEIIWDRLNEIYYKDHPYYAFPKGKIETINRISVNDLKKHLRFLTKENRIVISIVSGIPPQDIIEYLETEMKGFLSPKNTELFEMPSYNEYAGSREIREKRNNLMTSYVALKYDLPSIMSDEYPKMRIGLSVLSRRVYEILRTKHGLTYAAFVGASMRKANYGYFYVSTDYPDSALSLAMDEFELAKDGSISQEEIDNIINLYETSYYMQNEKSLRKSYQTGFDYLIYKDPMHSSRFIATVRGIKADQLQNLFKKYLNQYTIFILEKPE